MGEAIRRGLEAAYSPGRVPIDQATEDLIAEIEEVARELLYYGSWRGDREVFDVFRAALIALLLNHQGQTEPNRAAAESFQRVFGKRSSDDIGMLIAHAAIFAQGRERRGRLTGPTGLTGPAESSSSEEPATSRVGPPDRDRRRKQDMSKAPSGPTGLINSPESRELTNSESGPNGNVDRQE
jgi:hypothetical protein